MKYLPCSCGCDCGWLDGYPDQPCWGQVEVVEATPDQWVHACQGHIEMWEWCCGSKTAREYIPQPSPE